MEQYKCPKARVAAIVEQLKELKDEASKSGLDLIAAEISLSITALTTIDLKPAPSWSTHFEREGKK